MRRFGAFFANGIGDAVLALPAIRALKKAEPDTLIVIPSDWPFRVIFDEFAEDLRPLPFDGSKTFSPERVHVALDRPETVAFFTTWRNDSLVAWLEHVRGVTRSVGLVGDFAPYHVNTGDLHYFDRYMMITRALTGGGSLADDAYPHSCRSWDDYYAKALNKLVGIGDYCVVHPDTKADKTYEAAFWSGLIGELLRRWPDMTIVAVGRDHRRYIERDLAPDRIMIAPPEFSLAAYLVSRASRFIGVDSCFLHYADLQGIPSVGLFRTTEISRWGLRLVDRRLNLTPGDAPDIRALAKSIVSL